MSTLQFADRAKRALLAPRADRTSAKNTQTTELAKLRAQVNELSATLEAERQERAKLEAQLTCSDLSTTDGEDSETLSVSDASCSSHGEPSLSLPVLSCLVSSPCTPVSPWGPSGLRGVYASLLKAN